MNNKTLPYWLAVEESKTVRFSELAHLMAKAMHPGDDELMSYAAARINLETELKQAVKDGALTVRNASGLGRHTFAHGDALQRAVLIPSLDLGPFLNARGIELRLTPHGSGPDYWTLENAAAAIAEQEQWHDGARGSLENALLEAASSRALVVRHPHTDLPRTDGDVRAFYELVTPSDVNAWLEKQGAPYRWSVARPEMKPEPQAATPAPVVAESDGDALRAEEIPMKKKALIAALEHEWESIEADLSEATRNGLKDAAHASKHGEWYESKARAWAVSRGKIRLAAPAIHLAMWPGTVTRNRI